MSRKNRDPNRQHQLTIHVSPEMMFAIDQYMVGLGIDSRASAATLLIHAGMSSLPLDAALGYALKQAMNSVKKTEFEALANHFLQRAALLEAATR